MLFWCGDRLRRWTTRARFAVCLVVCLLVGVGCGEESASLIDAAVARADSAVDATATPDGSPPDADPGDGQATRPDARPPRRDADSRDAGSPDAGSPDANTRADALPQPNDDPFPVSWQKGQIERVEEQSYTEGATRFRATYYRNRAYRCGRRGYFTFVVTQEERVVGQRAPLWVFIHGGGAGYFDDAGAYHPSAGTANDEEPMADLLRRGPKPQRGYTLDRRVAQGYRFLLPAMCDHDFHSGLGTPYPNNPNWENTDTVDGLLALMAAIDFTANGSEILPGYSTSHIFLHGVSSGSAGAYAAAYGFVRSGVPLNGAILDATLINDRQPQVMGFGRLPPEMRDPSFGWQGLLHKVGVLLGDAIHFAENRLGGGFPVPLYDVVSANDPFCGGEGLLEVAANAGAETNCDFVHQAMRDGIDARPESEHHRWFRGESGAHVLTLREGPLHDLIDAWLTEILVDAQPPSWR